MSFMGRMCLLTRLQELRRVRILGRSAAYLDKKNFFWFRTMPSTMERINYAILLPMSMMQIRNRLPRDRVPEDDVDWVNLVQYAQRIGIDMSKIGLGEDLLDWMWERYGRQCLKTWPQLEGFHIGCRGNRYDKRMQEAEAFVSKIRPDANIQFHSVLLDLALSSGTRFAKDPL
ncbi:hypothetical protein FBU30_007502 [Linnemannia zychae]|nr:hypothetical protein FBU30_007502 [Linnemannia zychae]